MECQEEWHRRQDGDGDDGGCEIEWTSAQGSPIKPVREDYESGVIVTVRSYATGSGTAGSSLRCTVQGEVVVAIETERWKSQLTIVDRMDN